MYLIIYIYIYREMYIYIYIYNTYIHTYIKGTRCVVVEVATSRLARAQLAKV